MVLSYIISEMLNLVIGYWKWHHSVNHIQVLLAVLPDRIKLVTLIAGSSKRRSSLMEGDDDEMFMKRSLNVTPKTTEQNLIVRSGKSEVEVTNNRRLRSMYCTIEANYWQTRSIARPLCESRATSITTAATVSHNLANDETNKQTHATNNSTSPLSAARNKSIVELW